jgi:hypothetical protein
MANGRIRICEQSFIARVAAYKLGASSVALTIGRSIHLHNVGKDHFKADRRWVVHELKHVEQFKRYGFLPFIVMYLAECIRKGYWENRFEVEARAAEDAVVHSGTVMSELLNDYHRTC